MMWMVVSKKMANNVGLITCLCVYVGVMHACGCGEVEVGVSRSSDNVQYATADDVHF